MWARLAVVVGQTVNAQDVSVTRPQVKTAHGTHKRCWDVKCGLYDPQLSIELG